MTFAANRRDRSQPAIDLVWVPDDHLAERDPHCESGVAAQVLVGQKQDFLAAREGPIKGRARIGRGADQAAALAAKGLDRGGGVHIGQRQNRPIEPGGHQRIPAVLHLADLGHVGHRTPSIQVRQKYLLIAAPEDVGALGHEMDAAEDDILALGLSGDLRQLVGISSHVGEADHLIALVVMAEQNCAPTQLGPGCGNAVVHRVIGEYEIVLERTSLRSAIR